MSTADAPALAPRRSRALGAGALLCAILAPLWLFAGIYVVILASADSAPTAVVVLANILGFGWFVVPVAVLGALVLGVLAVLLKRGTSLGVAALVLLLLDALGVVVWVAAALQVFS